MKEQIRVEQNKSLSVKFLSDQQRELLNLISNNSDRSLNDIIKMSGISRSSFRSHLNEIYIKVDLQPGEMKPKDLADFIQKLD
jgi:DNA-binding CsgD family transcriptional regulator